MAITQAVANTFKPELMQALHNFTLTTGNVFKIAMYTSSATLGAGTTVYSSSNEVTGTAYVAGGNTLTNVTPTLATNTGITDFADTTWSTSTITNARGALIYNSTNGNRAVVVLDFGADKSSSAGDFTIQMPAPTDTTAIIRIA
jgi:hypothetical protein